MNRFKDDFHELEALFEKAEVPFEIQIEIRLWLGQHDHDIIEVCRQTTLQALEPK